MDRSTKREFKSGFFVLLDALGTRGVWDRPEGRDYAERLADLLKSAQWFDPGEKGQAGSFAAPLESTEHQTITRVATLSDTLVIAYEVSEPGPLALRLLSGAIVFLFREALKRGILLRGAVCAGEFHSRDSVFIGRPVDEAATWYESSDWAGVIAAPSLKELLSRWPVANDVSIPCFVRYAVPLKHRVVENARDPDGWALTWPAPIPVVNRQHLSDLFTSADARPDVERKRRNTLEFYDFWTDKILGQLGAQVP